jgi:hypothetical protein
VFTSNPLSSRQSALIDVDSWMLSFKMTGNARRYFLPVQGASFVMHASTPRQRAIIRSVALLQMLKRRVAVSSVYAFAEYFDALANPKVPTQGQGKNGWQALFNGTRPLSADRLKALASVPAWEDAEALYEHGPDGLWLAMWGPLESLKGMFGSELAESRTFDQLLAEFEGDLLVAEACRELLNVRFLARSVALHRIHRGMARLAPLELDGGGTVRCVKLCLTMPPRNLSSMRWASGHSWTAKSGMG